MAERDEARKQAAEAFYGALGGHGDAARRVGWESAEAHALRLWAMVEALAPVETLPSLIDVGCGEGALLPVLREAGFAGSYHGEDVREGAIGRAKAAHAGDPGARFAAVDSFGGGAVGRAAAVVCSGTLNTVSGEGVDHDAEVCAALAAMWERAEEVLALDVAVADRHAEGVGIARVDLMRLWEAARALAPVVVVREDVIAGEALLVLSRGRARAFSRRRSGPEHAVARAKVLLSGGEAAAALAEVEGALTARAELVRGAALGALGRAQAALDALTRAAVAGEVEGDRALVFEAKLAMAPCLWRLGARRAAETLLEGLAEASDEARAHLFELVMARRDVARAERVAATIEDPWVRRELERRLARVRG